MASQVEKNLGLSIIMPAFNEEETINEIIENVLKQHIVQQLIIVDDGSSDSTSQQVEKFEDKRIFFVRHEKNMGKGAAIRTAQKLVNQELVLIQDADLEYDPAEYYKLVEPIEKGFADVVYGSRFQTGEMRRVLYFWHYVGNRFLTLLSNAFTNINLSDMETCYKAIKTDFFNQISIQEKRFGIEPELTGKLAALGARFYEVSISYNGRTYDEGKKIGVKDGFRALYCIVKYNKWRGLK